MDQTCAQATGGKEDVTSAILEAWAKAGSSTGAWERAG